MPTLERRKLQLVWGKVAPPFSAHGLALHLLQRAALTEVMFIQGALYAADSPATECALSRDAGQKKEPLRAAGSEGMFPLYERTSSRKSSRADMHTMCKGGRVGEICFNSSEGAPVCRDRCGPKRPRPTQRCLLSLSLTS